MMERMFQAVVLSVVLFLGRLLLVVGGADPMVEGTIFFTTVGRSHFSFDVYAVNGLHALSKKGANFSLDNELREIKISDGVSVNYNGQFVEGLNGLRILDQLRIEGNNVDEGSSVVVFLSDRNGSPRIYFNIFMHENRNTRGCKTERREPRDITTARSGVGAVLVDPFLPFDKAIFLDRPSMTGDSVIYVSTFEASQIPRQSWAAVYSTNLRTGATMRLTPYGVADFSPSISTSGKWVAVASSERTGFQGETEELSTDLVIFKSEDGSGRRQLIKHGGWPSWADDHTIFFHRKADDGWWSIYRVTFPETFLSSGIGEVQEARITPPGIHVFTPSASSTGNWIAVATRRPGPQFRHVEIFDLTSKTFFKLTENISPNSHHYNPFVSQSTGLVGYHRCRGKSRGQLMTPLLQLVSSPIPNLALVQVDGTFPSISPDGSLIAFTRSTEDSIYAILDENIGVFVSNRNGGGLRKVFTGQVFSTAWDWKRKGVLYTSYGHEFKSATYSVDIIALHNVDGDGELSWQRLTKTGNNAFPSPSPDGKYLVFRSGRSGHKNLYIMDAVDGEEKGIWQLTDGPWKDQHPFWSPTGEWIAFSSNRENPSSSSFSIYLIRPNGTGLHKVLQSSQGGVAVHPQFSPDGQKLVFISDLAALSGEPISLPHQFTPYGDVFIANLNGSNIQRLTHNAMEDGTPSWSPSFLSYEDISSEGEIISCDFFDPFWLASKFKIHSSTHLPDSRRLPPIKCQKI